MPDEPLGPDDPLIPEVPDDPLEPDDPLKSDWIIQFDPSQEKTFPPASKYN